MTYPPPSSGGVGTPDHQGSYHWGLRKRGQSNLAATQRALPNGDGAGVALRPGSAADWVACWAMDVSYDTEYVWQLQSNVQADVPMTGFVKVRLPRAITLRDPLWGGEAIAPQQPQGSLTVAELQGSIDGFALVVPNASRAIDELQMVAVRAHARRCGLGNRLLQSALDVARRNGRRALCATVQARNFPAIRLLQAAGFVLMGYDEQYYPSNDVGLKFGHRLAHDRLSRLVGEHPRRHQ